MKTSTILENTAAMAAMAERLLEQDGRYQRRTRPIGEEWTSWLNWTMDPSGWQGDLFCEVRSLREGVAEFLAGKWVDFTGYDIEETIQALAGVVPEPDEMERISRFLGGGKWGMRYEVSERIPWRHSSSYASSEWERTSPNDILALAGEDPIEPRKSDPHAEAKAKAKKLMERDGGYLWRRKPALPRGSLYTSYFTLSEKREPSWSLGYDYDIVPISREATEQTPCARLDQVMADMSLEEAERVFELAYAILDAVRSERDAEKGGGRWREC